MGRDRPDDGERGALDSHRSAMILTLLVLLSGAITIPWQPFRVVSLTQTVVCASLLVYLLRTWARPRQRIAEVISTLVIVYALVLVPWAAIVWCRLERPLEAFTVPQLAIITMALVFVGRWRVGIATMCLFAAESLFVFGWARHSGLSPLIPIGEPVATIGFTMLGIGLFVLRRRRGELTRQYVQVQAEIRALDRIRPAFLEARAELETQLAIIAAETHAHSDRRAMQPPRTISGALERLGELGDTLQRLLTGAEPAPAPQAAERRLRDHDAQLGAIFLTGISVVIGIPAMLWSGSLGLPIIWYSLLIAIRAALLVELLRTRRRPSARRALVAVLVVVASTLTVVTFTQGWVLELGRPYVPFLAHKLLMVILGLTLATRFRLGVVLIGAITANAIVLWFVLDLGSRSDIIAISEPWVTLAFSFVGLASLQLLEQRQIASIQLLRAETEASAMQRRALLFLALRDRLNSPLQTLVIGASTASLELPRSSAERIDAALDRLVELSHELAEIPMPSHPSTVSFDAEDELRRRF